MEPTKWSGEGPNIHLSVNRRVLHWSVPQALIAKEWLEHGQFITWWLVLWAIGLFLLPALTTPMAIGIFGSVYALWIAQRVGGSDVVQGTEETTFALPATRREILLARLWVVGWPLVLMVLGGMLALAVHLPAFLWGLIVESGFTELPESGITSGWLVWTLMPLTALVLDFCASATAKQRGMAGVVGGGIAIICAVLGGFSSGMENSHSLFFGREALASLVLIVPTLISGWYLLKIYPRKEATINPEK